MFISDLAFCIHVCIYVCVCVHVWAQACKHAGVYVHVQVCVRTFLYAGVFASMSLRVCGLGSAVCIVCLQVLERVLRAHECTCSCVREETGTSESNWVNPNEGFNDRQTTYQGIGHDLFLCSHTSC